MVYVKTPELHQDIVPENPVGKKFLLANGRMGKVTRKLDSNSFGVRTVGNNYNRNVYSYKVSYSYLTRAVAWFNNDEIKIMYGVPRPLNVDNSDDILRGKISSRIPEYF